MVSINADRDGSSSGDTLLQFILISVGEVDESFVGGTAELCLVVALSILKNKEIQLIK